MLMSGRGREAKVHYLDGTFRLLAHGDFVHLDFDATTTGADTAAHTNKRES